MSRPSRKRMPTPWIIAVILCLGVPAAGAAARESVAAVDTAAVAAADTAAAPHFPEVPFGPGEVLDFSIDYGPINAGDATLAVRDFITSNGDPCYLVESRVRSNRFFSAFYMVRDKVVSHIDRRELFSRYFAKRLREGDYRKNIAIRFDPDGGKAYYADGRVFDVPSGTQDILSAFYFVRTMELAPGDTLRMDTHTSRKNYTLKVIVHRRESVTVPAGTFDCLVVEPIILGEGLFQFEGSLNIWLTDDPRRMPVLMRTKVKVGAIDASLKDYRLATTPEEGGGR